MKPANCCACCLRAWAISILKREKESTCDCHQVRSSKQCECPYCAREVELCGAERKIQSLTAQLASAKDKLRAMERFHNPKAWENLLWFRGNYFRVTGPSEASVQEVMGFLRRHEKR